MLPSFCRDSIVIVRPGSKTVRGTTVADWSSPSRKTVRGCSVQPDATSTDMASDRDAQATESCTVYLPPDTDVQAGDRVEWDGDVWEIDGRARTWRSPTGRVTHRVMRMRVYQG